MLNILLHSLAPDKLKPNKDLIGMINSLRKIRNDLIHYGIFKLNYDSSFDFTNYVFDFKNYMSELISNL